MCQRGKSLFFESIKDSHRAMQRARRKYRIPTNMKDTREKGNWMTWCLREDQGAAGKAHVLDHQRLKEWHKSF